MLDTIFKSAGDRRQDHDDLRTLVAQARDERAALGTLLAQVGGASAKLARTSQALDDLGDKANGLTRQARR